MTVQELDLKPGDLFLDFVLKRAIMRYGRIKDAFGQG